MLMLAGLHAVALDVVETLVRSSQAPLSDALMQTFPCTIHLSLTSDDAAIVQNGGGRSSRLRPTKWLPIGTLKAFLQSFKSYSTF